ncbi:TIGR04283 family arsenosugar biosynthesis glycosyltransferase [Halomonas llamarensis]|uniref:TIGR04283 family arsenosugar biosynthesis glycosyltransferase n=1 Tax=Halomonas llamarensis TaxID=2945104 RepID=A0ABT0SNN0_9GAMM|nr:TIGR04283 family arsenosugar biosynthesis glycosyltransferase [Halomonas llamarensis]MCL7929408.1 TIGR04283 family arsenosugar biosynthesis glycosyltransferase [Halomonas llamarensis]
MNSVENSIENSAEKTPHLSIVITVLNEAAALAHHLTALTSLGSQGIEIIVVDGGSVDASVRIAQPLASRVITSLPGRARQMNLGAQYASAPALLFLHADTHLPPDALKLITQTLVQHPWGRFAIRLEGKSRWLPLISAMINLRSRLSGIATGDQALFMRRDVFDTVEGFPEQPLMEDIEITKRLKRLARPACLRAHVISSGRRWDQHGVWRTILLMWRLRYRYWRGVSADELAKAYRHVR